MNCDKLNLYLYTLYRDIYYQPEDEGHTDWAQLVIDEMCPKVNTVLDVGCGTAFCEPIFAKKGISYVGCTLGEEDLLEAKDKDRRVFLSDMSDIDVPDNSTDLIFARHVLEHSPMPIITLMEWHRVSSKYLLLVMPSPEYWTYAGKNHYNVANKDLLWNWFDVSNWNVVDQKDFMTSNKLFMKHYMPQVKDRSKVTYPGRPIPVEYWYLLEAK